MQVIERIQIEYQQYSAPQKIQVSGYSLYSHSD